MLNAEVRSIMTKNPLVAQLDDNAALVSKAMVQNRLQQIPVVHDGKLEGLITAYDLWQRSINHHDESELKVRDVMTTNVLVIAPKDKVGTAAELFVDSRFKTLPVVNLRNELKGIITTFDVIRHVMQREYPQPILYKEVLEA